MKDFNEYMTGCFDRFEQIGDFQAFAREVFAARWECGIAPEVWQEIVPKLIESVFQPLIVAGENTDSQNYRMVVMGMYLNNQGFEVLAEEWLERAADAAEGLTTTITQCNAYGEYGALLRITGRIDEAATYLRRAADSAEGLTDNLTRSNAFLEYGVLLMNLSRVGEAVVYLRRAADEAEGLDDPRVRSNAFFSYGDLLRTTGQIDEAVVYLRRAVDAAEEFNSPLTRSNAFLNYGTLLQHVGQTDEAAVYLKRAADAAAGLDDPITRCNAARQSAKFYLSQKQYNTALAEYRAAQQHLQTALASNRYPQGISTLLGTYADMFDAGLFVADRVFFDTKEPAVLLDGVASADGLKAVSVREGLRRHSNRRFGTTPVTWEPGPDDWTTLFGSDDDPRPHTAGAVPVGRVLRAVRAVVDAPKRTPTILELPGDDDPTKIELSLPLSPAELAEVLPDDDTVAIVFHFLNDDLYILPVRRGADGTPRVVHTDEGYFWVPKSRPVFDKLLGHQLDALAAIKDGDWYKDGAAELRAKLEAEGAAGGFDLMAVPFALNKLLRLDELLPLIEPDPEKWADLHLVFLPDGPLYQLPLHAAAVTVGEDAHVHLIDVVGSVRYALSLRTLHTLGKVEAEQTAKRTGGVPLRGVAFVNPSGTVGDTPYGERLGFATREVEHLLAGSPDRSWRIFGERHQSSDWLATRANMARFHPTPSLLWSVCHGGLMPDTFTPRGFAEEQTVVNPSLLLADGPLSTARMVSEGYDLRAVELWHNSCCLLGRLETADGHRQVEGYVAALTLLGCRRVSSAAWELADHAAAEFARHLLARLRVNVFDNPTKSPHAVAVSLKEAMAAFRADKSNGDFDHPYYWAPYTLYGLG